MISHVSLLHVYFFYSSMSTIRRVFVDFHDQTFGQLEDTISHINVDFSKVLLVLSHVDETISWVLPLIDSWLDLFPGRVFLEHLPDTDSPLSLRVPLYSKTTVWRGYLQLSTLVSIYCKEPIRYDRLPISEDLHVLGSVVDSQLELIPISGKSHCVIDSTDCLHNLVLISPASDWTKSKLFLLTNGDAIQSIQSPEIFLSLYQTAVAAGKEDTYLRSLAMGPNGTVTQALLAKKQLDILNTVALMDSKIKAFFDSPHPSSSTNETAVSNFENLVINKQIRKEGIQDQTQIDALLARAAAGTSFHDMMYKGKRHRRVLGTLWNSHQWPVQPLKLPNDGLLLSEVLGSVFP